jgi:hypothetical protein
VTGRNKTKLFLPDRYNINLSCTTVNRTGK